MQRCSGPRSSGRESSCPPQPSAVWWLTGAFLQPVTVLLTLALQSLVPLVALLALSAVIAVGVVGGRLFAAALLEAGAEPASWESPDRLSRPTLVVRYGAASAAGCGGTHPRVLPVLATCGCRRPASAGG